MWCSVFSLAGICSVVNGTFNPNTKITMQKMKRRNAFVASKKTWTRWERQSGVSAATFLRRKKKRDNCSNYVNSSLFFLTVLPIVVLDICSMIGGHSFKRCKCIASSKCIIFLSGCVSDCTWCFLVKTSFILCIFHSIIRSLSPWWCNKRYFSLWPTKSFLLDWRKT